MWANWRLIYAAYRTIFQPGFVAPCFVLFLLVIWCFTLDSWNALTHSLSVIIASRGNLLLPIKTLNVRGPSYLGLTRSISWLLMPGSFRRQDISSHDIDYVEYAGPNLTWGRILRTCVISVWSNDIKYKYMFMLSLKNAARKGLSVWSVVEQCCACQTVHVC